MKYKYNWLDYKWHTLSIGLRLVFTVASCGYARHNTISRVQVTDILDTEHERIGYNGN